MFIRNKNIILFGAVVLLFVGVVFIYRGIQMQKERSPLQVTYKVRNASAHEDEWRLATAAQAGDVIEHFLLVHLPAPSSDGVNYSAALANVKMRAQLDKRLEYREGTLASVALGINEQSGPDKAKSFFSGDGLTTALLGKGEFVDIKWQSRLPSDVAFNNNEAPLLESRAQVAAANFSKKEAKALISFSSTLAREEKAEPDKKFYLPKLLSMNPRTAFDDLGTGVVIAGDDLAGVKILRLAGQNRILANRLVSNDLLEAGIPAGLSAGDYQIEAVDKNGKTLPDKLSFTVRSSNNRVVVTSITPSIVKSGRRSTIVLQGIRLGTIKIVTAQDGQTFNLENIKKINDRVLAADVPAGAKRGEYQLVIEDMKQEPVLRVD